MFKFNEMTLVKMLGIVKEIGTVTSANWYDDGYITVSGITEDGKVISMSMIVKEEEKKDA